MEITEKKEGDNKGLNAQPIVDASAATDREAEERERQARELKSGLHPLKVSLLSIFVFYWCFIEIFTPFCPVLLL